MQRQYRYAHKKLEVKSKTCPGCTGVALQTSSIVAGYLYGADTAARVSHPRVVRVLVSCSFSCSGAGCWFWCWFWCFFGCCLLFWLLAVSWFRALGRKNRKKGQKRGKKGPKNTPKYTRKTPKNTEKPQKTASHDQNTRENRPKSTQKPLHTTKIHEKIDQKSTKNPPQGPKMGRGPQKDPQTPQKPLKTPQKPPYTTKKGGTPPPLGVLASLSPLQEFWP